MNALTSVAWRCWTAVPALGGAPGAAVAPSPGASAAASPAEPTTGEDEWAWARQVVERAAEAPRAAGLVVSSRVAEGDPKRLLPAEAEAWGADCIFLGARGLRSIERFMLGGVSTAVAVRAHCSVEVVRPQHEG